ncbi:alpha/beta fold hydrolase [Bacillus sp. HMF5848]|uniref:alpha/beta fold hydrolase n=1 Tax=Bacillus sp. HMF5848 TaxID=2495421 RepID=UPI000F774AAA|nr:alpha/beta fold hydrolase [Bacillus sp. HMF5848]RSK26625.1 alpha/beta fold hydrolase [Bacillus sp. HMF5848]
MATETPSKPKVPALDYQKEMRRWKEIYKALLGPDLQVGTTPRVEVWRKNKTVLWYYPAQEKKYNVPLFFVYSLLNKPYILDIAPGSSVIGGLTEKGYDVYMLDWGSPGIEDSEISLDTYVDDYLRRAIKRAIRHSDAGEISLVGYCLGGTLSAIYTSISDEPIRNLILATVPIDFSMSIVPPKWLDGLRRGILSVDSLANVYGTIPAEYLYLMFRALSPIYLTPYTNLISRADDKRYVDKWRRMDKWTRDTVSFSGKAFKQFFNDLYKENKLVKGEMQIGGKQVDLSKIDCSLFVVSSSNDNLVVEPQSLPIMDLVSSKDKTYQLIEAGHVSLALTGVFADIIDPWLASRSDALEETKV